MNQCWHDKQVKQRSLRNRDWEPYWVLALLLNVLLHEIMFPFFFKYLERLFIIDIGKQNDMSSLNGSLLLTLDYLKNKMATEYLSVLKYIH